MRGQVAVLRREVKRGEVEHHHGQEAEHAYQHEPPPGRREPRGGRYIPGLGRLPPVFGVHHRRAAGVMQAAVEHVAGLAGARHGDGDTRPGLLVPLAVRRGVDAGLGSEGGGGLTFGKGV